MELMRAKYMSQLNKFINEQVEEEEMEIIEDAIKTGNSYSMEQLQNMGSRFKNTFINQMLEHDSEVKAMVDQQRSSVNKERQ